MYFLATSCPDFPFCLCSFSFLFFFFQEYEKYLHDKENYTIINVPPNFMFKAQVLSTLQYSLLAVSLISLQVIENRICPCLVAFGSPISFLFLLWERFL